MNTIEFRLSLRHPFAMAVVAVATVLLLAPSSNAQILEENFAYAPGTDLTTTANWDLARNDSGQLLTTSGDLTYPNYNLTGGNQVSIVPGSDAASHTFAAATSGAIYIAVLVNFSAVSVITDSGIFMWGGNDNDLIVHELTILVNEDGAGNLRFGIGKGSGNSFTGYDYGLNETHLLVAKYQIVAGTDNDVVSLYVNPDLTTGMEPAVAEATNSAGADAVDGSSSPFFASVVISGVDQSTGPPTGTLDNMRISTSWDTSALPVELIGFEVQ